MSREQKLAKNTLILAVGTFLPKLAAFILVPVLTGYLSKADYGTYELVLTLVGLILPAATLQIQSAAFRFLIDCKEDEEEQSVIISNIYSFIFVTSTAALIITFVVLHLIHHPLSICVTICLYFFFDIIANANKQVIRGLGRNIDYAIGSFISAIGQMILIFSLVVFVKIGLLGGLIGLAGAEFLSATYLLFRGRIYKLIKFRNMNRKKLKELLAYSWPMVPNSLSQWVMHVSDRLVITGFMGPVANGIYAAAYKVPSILNFAQSTFNMAWQENASIVSKDDDTPKYYSEMFAVLFDIVAGCMAVLIGITPFLFKVMIRGDYGSDSYYQIPILYMGTFFFCLSSFWGGIFVAFKKTVNVGVTTVAAAALNLLIDLTTIHYIGLYAASISTLVSYIALCAFRLISVRRFIKLKYNILHCALVLSFLTAQCVACYQQNRVLNIITFVAGMAAGMYLTRNLIKGIIKKLAKIIRKRKKA